jgi:hypothetical protein
LAQLSPSLFFIFVTAQINPNFKFRNRTKLAVTYYEINLVIFKYCFVFRLVAEQQDWKELQVDVTFLIGRDLQNAKVMEMARGMLTCGNLDLLP